MLINARRRHGWSAWLLCAATVLGCGKSGPGGWPKSSLGEIDHGPGLIDSSLIVDSQGRPVVAYSVASGFSPNQALVKRWNGTSWEALGGQLNATGTLVLSVLLAADSAGMVAVWEDAQSTSTSQTTVRAARWTGTSWSPLGAQVSPSSSAKGLRVAANPQALVVSFANWGSSLPGTVVRWNGVGWQQYPATSSVGATYLDLALLMDGSPVASWVVSTSTTLYTVSTQRWDSATSTWISLPPKTWNSAVNTSIVADASGAIFLASGPAAGPDSPVFRAGSSSWDAVGAPPGGAAPYARFVRMAGAIALLNLGPNGYAVSRYLGGSQWEVVAETGIRGTGGSPCGFTGTDTSVFAACSVYGSDIDANGKPVIHLLATQFTKP